MADGQIMTVVATSPLTVRQDGATVPINARLLRTGVGASYVPVVDDRVCVEKFGGFWYVVGGA